MPMNVTAVETIRVEEFPNIVWVQVHTDGGLTGLGETSFMPAPVEAHIHETIAPYLLGSDPLQIDRHWRSGVQHVAFAGTGAEMRARSALDIALWDLFGKATGQPVYQLLGGLSHDRIRTYNTCAGYGYIRSGAQSVANFGLEADGGPYEDLDAFLHRADELAHSLLAEGITAMKIWPFDAAAEESGGHRIERNALRTALEPFRRIREAVGDRIDILVEMHGLWDLPCAVQIAHATEEYEPYWFEDPIRMHDLGALREFSLRTKTRTTASETLAGRWGFRDLLEQRAASVIMFDPAWCGGISEARKIAAMAEAYQLPVAPHDCLGPVEFLSALHVSFNAPNTLVQESVRAFYTGWYTELVTHVPRPVDGWFAPPPGPGLGTGLDPDRFAAADVHRRISAR